MSRPLHTLDAPTLIRDHALDLARIGLVHDDGLVELALALGGLAGQDVADERVSAFDLAGRGLLEPLRRTAMRLQFRHTLPWKIL